MKDIFYAHLFTIFVTSNAGKGNPYSCLSLPSVSYASHCVGSDGILLNFVFFVLLLIYIECKPISGRDSILGQDTYPSPHLPRTKAVPSSLHPCIKVISPSHHPRTKTVPPPPLYPALHAANRQIRFMTVFQNPMLSSLP